ncbi:hypothetical protein [Sphingobium sp.]|uniref:hypothetical protein n=1 Tax=Sphingobium sp. TaxID=1912891 RepID=UPI003B3BCEEA
MCLFRTMFTAIPMQMPALGMAMAAAAFAFALPHQASAQVVTLPSGSASGQAIGYGSIDGPFVAVDPSHPLPVAGLQEKFALVTANNPAAATMLYGGDYIFAQSCSAYGTVALEVRGPDGVTFQPIVSRTASDSSGGTGVALGAQAVVRATVAGTTACNVTLSRVP